MQQLAKLYTFIGCAYAVRYHALQSTAPDQATALAAAESLLAVGESLMADIGQGTTEEEFKEICSAHVTTVLEAIESLRGTSLQGSLNQTLNSLLEYFYSAADALMGGGGYPPPPYSSMGSIFPYPGF